MGSEKLTVREKFREEYRIACPKDHTSLRPSKTTPTAYCRICEQSYRFEELSDKRA